VRDATRVTPHRAFLEELYRVAISAAHPAALCHESVDRLRALHPTARRIAILALGKAAPAMAEAAVERIAHHGATIIGGLVVGADDGPSRDRHLTRVAGDHPVPGARSLSAAARLATAAQHARDGADATLVLLSGGATSLIAAPVDGVTPDALTRLYESLLRSGWDIAAMNAVRKRFLRWGAGRLALALAPTPVYPAMLSDVIGDDAGTIASGPCSADPMTAAEILRRLDALTHLDRATRRMLTGHLERVVTGEIAETPKADHAAFGTVAVPSIRGNTAALAATADHALNAGWTAVVSPTPLRGEAHERGADIARALIASVDQGPLCLIFGGETTVSIDASDGGAGGRCQELALAAAQLLDVAAVTVPIALMAAGTDGRDGPTDAAGAIIDRDSWRLAGARGAAPADALASHDSHRALAAAGALMQSRSTGTNVMDIVVGLVGER
jgi:glycerate-2-kinase